MEWVERAVATERGMIAAVSARRAVWAQASRTIEQGLARFEERWRELTQEGWYIERRTNARSTAGLFTYNSNCVAIHRGFRFTGIGRCAACSSSVETESSGKLLFAQMPDGYIVVVAKPPRSRLKTLPFEQFVLARRIHPSTITYERVDRCLARYLWLQRIGSYAGSPRLMDRVQIFRFWLAERRHSTDWKVWLVLWNTSVILILSGISALVAVWALFHK